MKKTGLLFIITLVISSCGSINTSTTNKPGGRENPTQSTRPRDKGNTRDTTDRAINKSTNSNNNDSKTQNTNTGSNNRSGSSKR